MAMALASPASATASSMEAKEEEEPLVTILPQEVIDALAELDLELSEGKLLIWGWQVCYDFVSHRGLKPGFWYLSIMNL